MASESTDEQTVSLTVPAELSDWLDERASSLDVDRNTLLVQLLASYRLTADRSADGELSAVDIEWLEGLEGLEDAIRDIESEAESAAESAAEAAITEQLSEATNSVSKQLGNRIETLEADYRENLEDVRQRVIQVKQEADSKAPGDHEHEELEQLPELAESLDSLSDEVDELRGEFDERLPPLENQLDTLEEQLDQIEDRLKTVAWVVSDLRDAYENNGGLKPVDRIKRAAAKANVDRANCENCGESVSIGLLTDPQCPHCSATVSNVEPSSGWFGSAKLLTASQLEPGERR